LRIARIPVTQEKWRANLAFCGLTDEEIKIVEKGESKR